MSLLFGVLRGVFRRVELEHRIFIRCALHYMRLIRIRILTNMTSFRFNIWNTGHDVNFDRIAHLAKLVFNTRVVAISLVDGTEQ